MKNIYTRVENRNWSLKKMQKTKKKKKKRQENLKKNILQQQFGTYFIPPVEI
jgi:capsule polysaccharide modification protein KpsS